MQTKSNKLNLFSLTMLGIGFVIGMGIFRTAVTSAKDAISPSVYFSAWDRDIKAVEPLHFLPFTRKLLNDVNEPGRSSGLTFTLPSRSA